MEENKLIIKYNINLLKWATTVFFLLGNLFLLIYDDESKIFYMWFIPLINCLAIFSFVMLSIFPRIYFVFDENGCSYQDRKGNEKNYIAWENIKGLNFEYAMGIWYEGLAFEFKPGYENRWIGLAISHKQAKLIYDTFPKVKEIMDRKKH